MGSDREGEAAADPQRLPGDERRRGRDEEQQRVDDVALLAFAPGLIFTDTIRAELGRDEVTRVMGQQILPREGEEQDIVDALLFLVSPASSFITGETMRVTGGMALSV